MPQSNNPFEEFGGTEIATEDQQDPFAQFGGKTIETPQKKNSISSNGVTESTDQSSQDGNVVRTPTEILNESSGGVSGSPFVPKISSEPQGNPPFANPSKVGGYDWDKAANVIGHVDTPNAPPPHGDILGNLQNQIENIPAITPMMMGSKILAKSLLGSVQGTIQGAEEMSTAEQHLANPDQMKSNWQYLELPAAMVKTGFNAAGLMVPELAAFNVGTEAAQSVLPSDIVPAIMSPFSTLLQKTGGKIPIQLSTGTKIFDVGSPDNLKAAGELTDLLYQILLFHGTKELAGKVIHNNPLTPLDQTQVNDAVNQAFKEDVVPITKESLAQIPETVPDEIKVKAAPIIQQKLDAQTEIQNTQKDITDLEAKKQATDVNFQPEVDKQIDEKKTDITQQENKIESANNEIKTIISEPENKVGGEFNKEQVDEFKKRGFELNDNGIWVHKDTHPIVKKLLNGWWGKIYAANGGTHAGSIDKAGSGIAGSIGDFNFKSGKQKFLDLVYGEDKTESDYAQTLIHELGHQVYDKLTAEEKAIIENNQELTQSAKTHKTKREEGGMPQNAATDAEESFGDYAAAYIVKNIFGIEGEDYKSIPKEILPILEKNIKIPEEAIPPVEENKPLVENVSDSGVSGGKLADEGFRRSLVDEHFGDIVEHLKGKGLLKVEC